MKSFDDIYSEGSSTEHIELGNIGLAIGGPVGGSSSGKNGKITLYNEEGRVTSSEGGPGGAMLTGKEKVATVELHAKYGRLNLGGWGQAGDLNVMDERGEQTVALRGDEANLTLGGGGHDGDLRLQDSSGEQTISLNGDEANITLGGGGHDGDLRLQDSSGERTISLNGDKGEIVLKDWTISVPDYVFEPNYELPTLGELKRYVTEHKHLPGLPSAAAIEEGGLQLGSFAMGLLRQIEELCLHVLQQSERCDEAEQRLTRLEASVRGESTANSSLGEAMGTDHEC